MAAPTDEKEVGGSAGSTGAGDASYSPCMREREAEETIDEADPKAEIVMVTFLTVA